MTDMTALHAVLEAYKPELAAHFDSCVRWQFDRMVRDLGPKLANVGNDQRHARVWSSLMSSLVTRSDNKGRSLDAAVINDARVARAAAEYADEAVTDWKAKIAAKLGELESAKVENMGGMEFHIIGTKHGRRVQIEQKTIINVSSRGKVFNQFPARIYVDGKFTSEAAFKRLAA
jgi:hypothetical protein